ISVLGVFDGHGTHGDRAAQFVQSQVIPSFIAHQADSTTTTAAASSIANPSTLTATFHALLADLTNNADIDTYLSGTTATVIVVDETGRDDAVVANIGDARLVLGRQDG